MTEPDGEKPAAPEKATADRMNAERTLIDRIARLGIQVNGVNASAAAMGDAFQLFQAAFNAYQGEISSLLAESKALHESVTKLKQENAALQKQQQKAARKAEKDRPPAKTGG